MSTSTWQSDLSPEMARQVLHLAERVATHDEVAPFSEATTLSLQRLAESGGTTDVEVLLDSPSVHGVVVLAEDGSAELAVLPASRGRGIGGQLLDALLEHAPQAQVWAHGDLPSAQGIAASRRLQVTRNLWRMERPVAGDPAIAPAHIPDGFAARAFVPGSDDQAWLDLNATAFVDHPEQGRMTLGDLHERMAQPWFDPAGLLLIEDVRGQTPRLVASHWTKVAEPHVGEVYVVAVDPAYQGQGLGRAVTALGLEYLAGRAVDTIELYVEGDNQPAVATYRAQGFARASVDVMYSRAVHPGLTP